MRIFTHMGIDLDAACSVWAAREFIPGANGAAVEFRSADWDGAGMDEDDLALDIRAGGRGLKYGKDESGGLTSCFRQVMKTYASSEDRKNLRSLIYFVDTQDVHGSAIDHMAPRLDRRTKSVIRQVTLGYVLRALQTTYPNDDSTVLKMMSDILSGMLVMARDREAMLATAKTAELISSRVALLRNSSKGASRLVFSLNQTVMAVIYEDGNNLGVIYRSGPGAKLGDLPLTMKLIADAGEADEWFCHPQGFLLCRGSRKAPVSSPSRISPRALADAVAWDLG